MSTRHDSGVAGLPWPAVAALGMAGLALVLLALPSEAATREGDWTIGSGQSEGLTDETLELTGDLRVAGTLTLENATLQMSGDRSNLTVAPGGRLVVEGGRIDAAPGVRYNVSIAGAMVADNATFTGYWGAWAVEAGGTLEWDNVSLEGLNSIWGVKAHLAEKLVLKTVHFQDIRWAALLTTGNAGHSVNLSYELAEGGARHQHHFVTQLKLMEGQGVNLSSSLVSILNGTGATSGSGTWQPGFMELEVLGWSLMDDGRNLSNGPYSFRVGWPLVSQQLAEQFQDPGYTWGRVIWEEPLGWPAEGSSEPTPITVETPAVEFPFTAKVVTPDLSKWDNLTVEVTIENPNPVQVEWLRVYLRHELAVLDFKTIYTLDPYSNTTLLLNWTGISVAGSLELEVVLDPDGELTQWTDRSGNSRTLPVEVRGIDIPPPPNGIDLWLVLLVLLFMVGLVVYAVASNLKVEEEDPVADKAPPADWLPPEQADEKSEAEGSRAKDRQG